MTPVAPATRHLLFDLTIAALVVAVLVGGIVWTLQRPIAHHPCPNRSTCTRSTSSP